MAPKVLSVFCIAVLASLLFTACGSTNPTQAKSTTRASLPSPTPTLTPTLTPTPLPSPTRAPTATPTPKPSPTPRPVPQPQPTPQPTQAPPASPPILDLRPSSMSFVGHLDCRRSATDFICTAEVIADASNRTTLHWFAFANISSSISFSPAGGALAPGQGVFVSIFIPIHVCNQGLFFFRGPANTHTITWAC